MDAGTAPPGALTDSWFWPLGVALLAIAAWGAVARISYHLFRAPFPSLRGLQRLDNAAVYLAEQASSIWLERTALLTWISYLIIGAAVGLLIAPIISFNMVILTDVFDFLGLEKGDLYVLNLPFVGRVALSSAQIASAIFVASQAALGIIIIHMAPHLLGLHRQRLRVKDLRKRNHQPAEVASGSSCAFAIVGGILLLAVAFEASINALRTHVLTDGILLATVSSAFIGVVVPFVESIASGFFWHAFVVPLMEYLIPAVVAAFYAAAAATASLLAYPPPERRRTPGCISALNNIGTELNADFAHLEQTISQVLQLPSVQDDRVLSEKLRRILARVRSRGD